MIGDNKQKGFTFVEMLITAVVFSIIFGTAMTVLASAAKIQKYNLSQQQLLDQSSYAIEYIARALRMARQGGSAACTGGTNYNITTDSKRIDFVNYKGVCQHFLWDSTSGQIKVGGGDFSSDTPLTSSRYTINNLTFTKNGDSLGAVSYTHLTLPTILRV